MPETTTPSGLTAVTRWTGTQPPADVEQAMRAQGLGAARPFSPGRPINPFNGAGKPRSWDYQTGYNIGTRPIRDGRISFDTLKGIIDSWDLARIAIAHRIDDVRSLDWSLEAAEGVTEDVTTAIQFAREKLKRPGGPGTVLKFRGWLAAYLEDVLRYDAGALYRRRDRAGRVIGLQVVSGRSIAPLLDEYGGTPMPPAPAYAQFVQGVPWKWLTTGDLIYEPFRPQPDSPYGFAPLESILLTANTDLRMQQFFLGRFTEGNIPEGFATTPEGFTPTQIEEWQQYWDAFLYGDTERLSQIKWVPSGTQFEWAKDWKFDKDFQEFLITKTCAAFHVTPSDLGFTADVNRATSESQEDINFRIGTIPLVQHAGDILTSYLQDDLGLPVAFRFDTGMDKEDRVKVAQANKLYVEMGALSPDEVREKDLGLPVDTARPVGRFVLHSRRGPIPLLDIVSAAGRVDAETYGPAQDQPALPRPTNVAAVLPEEGTQDYRDHSATMQATQEATREALHPETGEPDGEPVHAALTEGVTVGSGITGYDLDRVRKADGTYQDEFARAVMDRLKRLTEEEARAIGRRFAEERQFPTADALAEVLKVGPTVAGLAVKAADTGRVLLLQRALTDDDPAAGTWEFPGGHLEPGEHPFEGANREWAEEVGCTVPPGEFHGTAAEWDNGIYRGHVWVIPAEADLQINLDREDRRVLNPDDPDGDMIETVAWFDPADLPGMPSLRPELTESAETWLPVIQAAAMPSEVRKGLRQWRDNARTRVKAGRSPRRFDDLDPALVAQVWPALAQARTRADVDSVFGRVVKAKGKGDPRRWRELAAPDVPQRRYDLRIVDHYEPLIRRALARMWPPTALRAAAEAGTLDVLPPADTGPLQAVLERLWADAWATGRHAAALQVAALQVRKDDDGLGAADVDIDWGTWEPGNLPAAALAADGGFAAALRDAQITIRGITDTGIHRMGQILSEGMLDGDSIGTIGRALREVVGSASRAELIAHTESARLQSLATEDQYRTAGIRQWDWLITDGACPRCTDRAAKNPHNVGDPTPPGHPRCRCAMAGRWQSIP